MVENSVFIDVSSLVARLQLLKSEGVIVIIILIVILSGAADYDYDQDYD